MLVAREKVIGFSRLDAVNYKTLSVFITGDYCSDAINVHVRGDVCLDIGELP